MEFVVQNLSHDLPVNHLEAFAPRVPLNGQVATATSAERSLHASGPMTSEACAALRSRSPAPVSAATVGVVITTYNHAHFLGEALASVRAQTRAADAIVVVDDGSDDDPGEVVARFPGVRCIRQDNRGLAAARNAGLTALTDALCDLSRCRRSPGAARDRGGLACFARAPDSGFVYGGHLYIDRDGNKTGERFEPPGESPYLHLLRRNFIAMHGTVMYRRDLLEATGGFDEPLRRCEDYDVYLRMARQHPIAGYPDLVAAYRRHGDNMSADHRAMLQTVLGVHARHAPPAGDSAESRAAWSEGRQRWRRYYAEEMALARYRQRQRGDAAVFLTGAAGEDCCGFAAGGGARRVRRPETARCRAAPSSPCRAAGGVGR